MAIGCFIASLVLLLLFFAAGILERVLKPGRDVQKWSVQITKFALLLFSGGVLLFGYSYNGELSFIGIAESLYGAVKLFFAGGAMYNTESPLSAYPVWNMAYFVLYYVICGIALYCTATAVVSLFHNVAVVHELKHRGKRKNLFVFSELNEKTLDMAESYLAEHTPPETDVTGFFTPSACRFDSNPSKRAFVFCNVTGEETNYEWMARARKLNALCVRDSLVGVHDHLRRAKAYKGSKNRITRYFLASPESTENVSRAIAVANAERSVKPEKAIRNLAVFVFATGEVNGQILDHLNDSGDQAATFFVRRLDPLLLFAVSAVADTPKNYLLKERDPQADRDLQVLVVGLGEHGLALVKMLCWFYQRKTGSITVHIVDKDSRIKSRMASLYPGLVDYAVPENRENDACFSLVFHEATDVFSLEFQKLLKQELTGLDAAYIALDDDAVNLEAAMHLRCLLDRENYASVVEENDRYTNICEKAVVEDYVRVFAVVHSDSLWENLNADEQQCQQLGFTLIGSNKEIYTQENIFNLSKEILAIDKHQKKSEQTGRNRGYVDAVNSYNANEYKRLNSLARAYHEDFRHYLYGNDFDGKIESKRRNAYMRACGFIAMESLSAQERAEQNAGHSKGPKRKWYRGKWHNSIVPYDEKCEAEKRMCEDTE